MNPAGRRLAAIVISALLTGSCGKYGPPRRVTGPRLQEPASVSTTAPEPEEVLDAEVEFREGADLGETEDESAAEDPQP